MTTSTRDEQAERRIAADQRYDVHALLALVERGASPELAPLDADAA